MLLPHPRALKCSGLSLHSITDKAACARHGPVPRWRPSQISHAAPQGRTLTLFSGIEALTRRDRGPRPKGAWGVC